MYDRRWFMSARALSGVIGVLTELLAFYSLFLQFERLFSGSSASMMLYKDIIFYVIIAALSVFVHELIGIMLDFGDRLELRGDSVWKKKSHGEKKLSRRHHSS